MKPAFAVCLPSVRSPGTHGHRLLLPWVTALACVLVQSSASLCEAGTVVRGRLFVPAPATASVEAGVTEPIDPSQAVIYVTQPEGQRGKKLKGKRHDEEMGLLGDRFIPAVIPLGVRSKVRFENRDRVYHNVFSISPARRFDLGKLPPAAVREVTFDSAGVVQLFCELHPAAAGFIVVCPNRVHARPSASGEYVLPKLPRGQFIVHAWHPRLGSMRRTIEVTGHGDLTVDLRF